MAEASTNSRLETFSDGVFAIAMTLLIIDVKLPSTASVASTAELWRALQHLAPAVFAFALSFGFILITWVNHHTTLLPRWFFTMAHWQLSRSAGSC
jgi:uncharacterized membrane protein